MSERARARRSGAVTSVEDPPQLASDGIVFSDRRDAGRRLAGLLEPLRSQRPVVVGIARGGVPVAAEVARALHAPLDVAVVRKIGAPQNPEFALGALAEGNVHVLSARSVRALRIPDATVDALIARAERELATGLERYRGARSPVELAGRVAILVDDGLATGRTALAAARSLRRRGAARVIMAAPVASPDAVAVLAREVDDVLCVETPPDLWAVGYWYRDFSPTSDEEVAALLATSAEYAEDAVGGGDAEDAVGGPRAERPVVAHEREDPAAADPPPAQEVSIAIARGRSLDGELTVPARPWGVVAFAHGSGSSRHSPRNREVARALSAAGLATLLFDLLTPGEEGERANVFDIPLLASRLLLASTWLAQRPDVGSLPLGYFGASTGAGAALSAAAEIPERVGAVVSRGGRPDLATNLAAVRAPTLLIVGAADTQVLELNRRAMGQLRCTSELAVIAGATHLFEEPGALEQVSRLAVDWFRSELAAVERPAPPGAAAPGAR